MPGGRTTIGEVRGAVAGHRLDGARCPLSNPHHLANPMVEAVDNVEVGTRGVDCDPIWEIEVGLGRGLAIAGKSQGSAAGHRQDAVALYGYLTDAVVVCVRNEQVAGRVQGQTGRIREVGGCDARSIRVERLVETRRARADNPVERQCGRVIGRIRHIELLDLIVERVGDVEGLSVAAQRDTHRTRKARLKFQGRNFVRVGFGRSADHVRRRVVVGVVVGRGKRPDALVEGIEHEAVAECLRHGGGGRPSRGGQVRGHRGRPGELGLRRRLTVTPQAGCSIPSQQVDMVATVG